MGTAEHEAAALPALLVEPTHLERVYLLEEHPRPAKELIEATGRRQAKISQHLALLRQLAGSHPRHASGSALLDRTLPPVS